MTETYCVGERLRVTVDGVVSCTGDIAIVGGGGYIASDAFENATIERIADPRLAVVMKALDMSVGTAVAQRVLDDLDAHAKEVGR